MPSVDNQFGRLVKEYLFFVGKTQTDLSAEIGLSLNKVSASMKGKYQLKKDHFDRIVAALAKWGVELKEEDHAQLLAVYRASVTAEAAALGQMAEDLADAFAELLVQPYTLPLWRFVSVKEWVRNGWVDVIDAEPILTSTPEEKGLPTGSAAATPPKPLPFSALLKQFIDNWCGAAGSFRDAAAAIGIDPATLSQYARGWRYPYYEETVQRIVQGLGLIDDDRDAFLAAWRRDWSDEP